MCGGSWLVPYVSQNGLLPMFDACFLFGGTSQEILKILISFGEVPMGLRKVPVTLGDMQLAVGSSFA